MRSVSQLSGIFFFAPFQRLHLAENLGTGVRRSDYCGFPCTLYLILGNIFVEGTGEGGAIRVIGSVGDLIRVLIGFCAFVFVFWSPACPLWG